MLTTVALAAGMAAQPQSETSVRGFVLTHEGLPVTSGTVVVETRQPASVINVNIDADGSFRVITTRSGLHHVAITAPGFATHRVDVILPRSAQITLPAIRLATPTSYHARFVNADGETIASPRLRMRAIDDTAFGGGRPVDVQALSKTESDGSVTVGPLPRGVIAIVADAPDLAPARLANIVVAGEESVLEGGTIVLRAGSSLRIDVVDLNGAPIPNQVVTIDDVRLPSFGSSAPARTDQGGRVTFDRLAEGTYQVATAMTARCNTSPPMSAVQRVQIGGNGSARARLIVGGNAAVRVRSPQGPMGGVLVTATSGTGEHVELAAMRMQAGSRPLSSSFCSGVTNSEGIATFNNLPAGPYSLAVRLPNSSYLRNVEFRGDGRETPITIPDGLLSVRVTTAGGRPVANARVIWSGDGYRVTATATANGDVLLEGVGEGRGSVGVFAPGYIETYAKVAAGAGALEITMPPLPARQRQLRLVSKTGEPVALAIVELLPATAFDIGVIGVTDVNGIVRFPDVPPRELLVHILAAHYVPAQIKLPANTDALLTVTLVPDPQ